MYVREGDTLVEATDNVVKVERSIKVKFALAEPVVIDKGRRFNRYAKGQHSHYWLRMRVTSISVQSHMSSIRTPGWYVEASGVVLTKAGRDGATYTRAWGRWNHDDDDPMPEWIAKLRDEAIELASTPFAWPREES